MTGLAVAAVVATFGPGSVAAVGGSTAVDGLTAVGDLTAAGGIAVGGRAGGTAFGSGRLQCVYYAGIGMWQCVYCAVVGGLCLCFQF